MKLRRSEMGRDASYYVLALYLKKLLKQQIHLATFVALQVFKVWDP